MNNITKTLGAFAVAGIVAAGGSAFTAGGVTNPSSVGSFIGGTVSQAVSGATLTGVTYVHTVGNPNTLETVSLAFTENLTDKDVTVKLGTGTPVLCAASTGTTTDCTVTGTAVSFSTLVVSVDDAA